MKYLVFVLAILIAGGVYAKQSYFTFDETRYVDVAPIVVTVPAPYPCNLSPGGQNVQGLGPTVYAVCRTGPEVHQTCKDKTRILLFGEDGVGHCISFSPITGVTYYGSGVLMNGVSVSTGSSSTSGVTFRKSGALDSIHGKP